jgi:ABC-type multidrug transport system ATPase subunit
VVAANPLGATGGDTDRLPWLAGIRHRRGSFVLHCDAWTTEPGLTVVVGLNGAGKTTLLDLLAGRQSPTEGSRGGRRFVVLPQTADISTGQTVRGVYAYLAGLRGVRRGERSAEVERVLALCDLDDRASQPVNELSGGWRKRVLIGQCLFGQPAGLLLDEPTSSLDVGAARDCWQLLKRLSTRTPAVVATHEASAALEFADRLVMIQGGHVGPAVGGDELRAHLREHEGSAESFLLALITPEGTP